MVRRLREHVHRAVFGYFARRGWAFGYALCMSWGYVLAAAGLTVIILFPCLDSKEGTFLRGWILGSSLLLCLLRMGLKLDEDYRFFKREGKVLP